MRGTQPIGRRVASQALAASSETLIEIPKTQDLTTLQLLLTGTLTIGTAVATAVPAESPAGFIQRLDLIANGREVLEQVPGEVIAWGNYGRAWRREITAPGATVATHAFAASYWLDRSMIDGYRPKDSAFQAELANLLQLRVTTGALSELVTPGGSTVLTLASANLDVYMHTLHEPENQQGEPKAVRKRTTQTITYTSANSNYRLRLPTGNVIRHITIHAKDSGAPSNSLVNSVQLAINGIDIRKSATWAALRSENYARTGVTAPTGFAVLDSADAGDVSRVKLSTAWDLRAGPLAELVLDLATATAGEIEVVIDEFVLPPVAAAA